jgi:malonyl-CoA/methylmalonyl-CoA synthetase
MPAHERTWSYADVDRRARQGAARLLADGVLPGDRVAAHVDKSPEALIVYLSVLYAGAVYLPLNPAYRADEVGYFLGDAEPVVAIGRPEDVDWFASVAAAAGVRRTYTLDGGGTLDSDGFGTWSEALDAGGDPIDSPVERSGDDLAAIVYTSGTTGRSKGAMVSNANLVSNAVALQAAWGFTASDVLIHALPIFHVHGLFVATNIALLSGIPMRFHNAFKPDRVIADFARSTVFMGVPTMYTRLLGDPALSAATSVGMRLFISGSAPLLAETHEQFEQRTGHVVLERYGMTETNMLTSNPLHGVRKPGTVGPPVPGVGVRVVDERGEVPRGSVGDVQVSGPNVFSGYWRRPDKNAEEFTADGWFKTGDVGRFDEDGYLELVGRSKDLVISGGYNVYPKEIELLIDEMPGIEESAVIGVPHADFGEGVTAVVTLRPGAPFDAAAAIADLKSRLAAFKVPKRIEVVDELPRNAMGKVQKNLLRERFNDLYA